MSNVKEYDELNISQLPAIEVLSALGYSYLSPTEAERQRGNLYNVLLTEVLQNQLNALNGLLIKVNLINLASKISARRCRTLMKL